MIKYDIRIRTNTTLEINELFSPSDEEPYILNTIFPIDTIIKFSEDGYIALTPDGKIQNPIADSHKMYDIFKFFD